MMDLDDRITNLEQKMKEWKKEIVHEFRVVTEDIRHDFKGAFKDNVALHEDRIVRVERRVVLTAA